jgi:type IV secretory pathway VirB3-like protein
VTSLRTDASPGLEAHPLPQATLHAPLFAGVEAPILGFEVGVLLVVSNLSQMRLVPVLVAVAIFLPLHLGLAAATRADRRLSLVFTRSLRYPRQARPTPTLATRRREPEPTFPRKLLT